MRGKTFIVFYTLFAQQLYAQTMVWNEKLLETAEKDDCVKTIKCLIETRGANINVTNNTGYTPLHKAARRGNFEVVRYFLNQNNIKINAQTYGGYTPLDLAWNQNHFDTATLLALHGAHLNKYAPEKKDKFPVIKSILKKTMFTLPSKQSNRPKLTALLFVFENYKLPFDIRKLIIFEFTPELLSEKQINSLETLNKPQVKTRLLNNADFIISTSLFNKLNPEEKKIFWKHHKEEFATNIVDQNDIVFKALKYSATDVQEYFEKEYGLVKSKKKKN